MSAVSKAEALARFGPSGNIMPRLAAKWSTPRVSRVPIPRAASTRLETVASRELRSWVTLFESYELEAADPAETELRAPGDLPSLGELLLGATGPSTVADLFSVLTASTVIAQQDDLAYLASLAGTASGVSKVYVFHPEDWGLYPSDASISLRLFNFYEAAQRTLHPFRKLRTRPLELNTPEDTLDHQAGRIFEQLIRDEPLPWQFDPRTLAHRSDWLVRAWIGLPTRPALDRAVGTDDFERELPLIPHHPHLALYWLFTHAFLGNNERFKRCLEATRGSKDPWVQEARKVLNAWVKGRGARLGPLRRSDFEVIRESARESVHKDILESPPRSRNPTPRSNLDLTPPQTRAFIELFDQLGEPAIKDTTTPPQRWLELEALLAERARPEFCELLDAALSEASQVADHHVRSGRGRILARAAISPDLEEFETAISRAGGTGQFGPRRRDEMWRGIARFSGTTASRRLVEGAKLFAREAPDWIRTASKVPWTTLLSIDTLETHNLVVNFLQTVPHVSAAAPLIIEVTQAARKHHIHRAVAGLRRAASGNMGRVDNGGRAEILWAIVELDSEASAFLRALLNILTHEWENASNEETADARSIDIGCVVGPLMAADPNNLEARATAAALLARFAVSLGPARQPNLAMLHSLHAVVLGIREGEIRPLLKPLEALSKLRPDIKSTHRTVYDNLQHLFKETITRLSPQA